MNQPLQKTLNIHEDCLLDFLGSAIHKNIIPKAVTSLSEQVELGMQWDYQSSTIEQ